MSETIRLGEITIAVTRKDIKHVHLSVHPPNGRVTLVAPAGTRLEVARAYAVSRLGWIRAQQSRLREQAREEAETFVAEAHALYARAIAGVRELRAMRVFHASNTYLTLVFLAVGVDALLPLYQQWGVAGIKFGFVHVGSQPWTKWLHDSIAKCAAHRLMVNVHDEYRMTGVERTTRAASAGETPSSTRSRIRRMRSTSSAV